MRRPFPRIFAAGATTLLFIGALAGGAQAAHAEPIRPQPPPPRKEIYDPDQAACRAEHLESHARQQLSPWADQPPEVLARLRLLQGEMLRASLRRCIARGLISPTEAAGVEQRLGFTPGMPALAPQPSSVRP
ncbi:MAG: hypothetical protein VKJ05_07865 [Synechococcaceae cyanobacterium]|nr:hypothetical protein [Synechococcaceae cyanobacterium]